MDQLSDSDNSGNRSDSPTSNRDENEQPTSDASKLTRCAVCQELTDNHHIHYGALCCFSCRAFFRRANQTTTKNTSYICKQDGKCDVSFKNRKKCQKCRYEACLRAGMDTSLVLTDEQKKARFRKKSEKRHETDQAGGGSHSRNDHHRGVNPEAKRKRKATAPTVVNDDNSIEDGIETLSQSNPFDAFELILNQSSSFNNHLQQGTIKELEDTLALAQEIHFQNKTRYKCNNPEQLSLADRQRQHSSGGNLLTTQSHTGVAYPDDFSEKYLCQDSSSQWQSFGLGNISQQHPALPFAGDQVFKNLPPSSNPFEKAVLGETSDDFNFADPLPTAEDLLADASIQPLGTCGTIARGRFVSQNSPSQFPQICSAPISPFMSASMFPSPISLNSILNSSPIITGENLGLDPPPAVQNSISPNDDYIMKLIADFEENFQPAEDLFRRLVSFHCGTTHFSTYDFGRTVSQLREKFRLFAVRRPEFQNLSIVDQTETLKASQSLFSHYLLARYVTASSGLEQIEWLIGPTNKMVADPYWMRFLASAEMTSIKMLTKDVGIFSDSGTMKRYYEVATRWLSRMRFTPQQNGIVAAIVLLSSNAQSSSGSNRPSIMQKEMKNLKSKFCKSPYSNLMIDVERDVGLLISELQELQKIFASQNDKTLSREALQCYWTALGGCEEYVPLTKELDMPFTREEEDWLGVQLLKYMSAYRDVPMGEDFVNEFIMFSYDVPLSKHFGFRSYATFAERFRRVLKTQPGFNDLTDRDQTLVWRQGCSKAVACCSAKSEHCPTGNDQLQFLFGELDKNIWQKNYAHQVSVTKINKIRKVMMTDINKISFHFDTVELMDYLRLVGTLGEVTSYNEFFPIFTLIALLSGEGLSQDGARFVTDTRNKYFTLLGRKLSCNRRAFNNICMGLNGIDELATLMKKLET